MFLSRVAWILALAIVFVLGLAAASGAYRSDVAPPLIGANYSHYRNESCSLDDTGLIAAYDESGVRRRVRAQLAAMGSAGIETLRLILWHMTQVGTHRWGVVASSGGRLSEPERSNLIRYLRDVRTAGFKQLTISFGPMWTNSPYGQPQYVYEPAKLEENWSFIRDVRALLKGHGPASIRVDLINEGAPSDYTPPEQQPGIRQYIAELYRRYVKAYGNEDVLVSAIAQGDASRLRQLVEILLGTGEQLPRSFAVHPSYSGAEALRDLRAADATLDSRGLAQPLVIGEEAYDDGPVAQAIAEFMRTSERPVSEVIEWPLTADRPCDNISVSAPYRADAYITALTGGAAPPATRNPLPLEPIPTLLGTVGPRSTIALRTKDGKRVKSLDAGRYRIIVEDRSRNESFHLTGPGVDEHTSLRFHGRKTWTLDLGLDAPYASRFTFRSDRTASLRGTFIVR